MESFEIERGASSYREVWGMGKKIEQL